MRYWTLWNGHAPMAKCEAPDRESAIRNFQHHGYGGAIGGAVDENDRGDYERLQVKALPPVGDRQPQPEKEEEEW